MLVIWMLGVIIVWRAKRLHITLTYVISFLVFSLLRSLITGHSFFTEASPLTGPMYQLFVFFMITDPATTVKNRNGQILVAFLIALVEFMLRLESVYLCAFLCPVPGGPGGYDHSSAIKQDEAGKGKCPIRQGCLPALS